MMAFVRTWLTRLPAPLSLWKWGEVVGFTALALAFCRWAQPDDPYFVRSAFPVLWFAPTMLGLRYGVWGAASSVGLIAGTWMVDYFPNGVREAAPLTSHFLGGVILSLICGQFGDLWQRRLSKAEQENGYLMERLEQITRRHLVLRLSHSQLEQHLVSKPITLRDALKRLRGMMRRNDPHLRPELAQGLMQLLGQYFQLEIAGFYPMEQGGPSSEPMAHLGPAGRFDIADPLAKEGLLCGDLCFLKPDTVSEAMAGRYLIVAPCQVSDGRILGWLTISQLRFGNFHHETFRMLKVFLGYFADSLHAMALAQPVLKAYPECPVPFAQELPKLIRLQQQMGIQSHLVVFACGPDAHQLDIVQDVTKVTRAVDLPWQVAQDDDRLVAILLPFTDAKGVEGYLARIQGLITERYHRTLAEAKVTTHLAEFDKDDAVALLTNLFSRCHG
jgi:hypothetical protein